MKNYYLFGVEKLNFIEIVNDILLFEQTGKNLLLLDIDETLVSPKNIYIYYKNPKTGEETKLTPEEYAKKTVTPEDKKNYDYREFRDPEKITNSIKTGMPIISNLKLMDKYIKNGWTIGILTARGMEEVVFKALHEWLKYKVKNTLKDIGDKLVRDLVFAVNDSNKKYEGATDFEKKKNVIEKLSKQYDRIVFVDDDMNNINAVKKLGIKNVNTRYAKNGE